MTQPDGKSLPSRREERAMLVDLSRPGRVSAAMRGRSLQRLRNLSGTAGMSKGSSSQRGLFETSFLFDASKSFFESVQFCEV